MALTAKNDSQRAVMSSAIGSRASGGTPMLPPIVIQVDNAPQVQKKGSFWDGLKGKIKTSETLKKDLTVSRYRMFKILLIIFQVLCKSVDLQKYSHH